MAGLSLNAVLGFGYRVYRLSKGGPLGDVIGQAVLGLVLIGVAVGVGAEWGWVRWVALAYAVLFAVIVMPVWVLAVLIPMKPTAVDYSFTIVYWLGLATIAIAAALV